MNSISPPRQLEDVNDAALVAEVLQRMSERPVDIDATEVDHGELVVNMDIDAATDYSNRLSRIQDFVLGFRDVPGAQQWWHSVGLPIVKMAAGEKL